MADIELNTWLETLPVVPVSFMTDIFRQSTKKDKANTKPYATPHSVKVFTTPVEATFSQTRDSSISITNSKLNTIVDTVSTTTPSFVIFESGEVGGDTQHHSLPTQTFRTDTVSKPNRQTTLSVTSTFLPESEYNSPTRASLFTLTALLGCIYGLAFILAVVWIVWLYLRRKTLKTLKRSQVDSREFCSINAIS